MDIPHPNVSVQAQHVWDCYGMADRLKFLFVVLNVDKKLHVENDWTDPQDTTSTLKRGPRISSRYSGSTTIILIKVASPVLVAICQNKRSYKTVVITTEFVRHS